MHKYKIHEFFLETLIRKSIMYDALIDNGIETTAEFVDALQNYLISNKVKNIVELIERQTQMYLDVDLLAETDQDDE